ncbi:sensor histidine kinase, partial [Methylogaea oryzae]|uniref:sensor histidine kinase n=1 Tax=Methylogaea oryzae TaxID=1295382 RepID=UPI0020D170D5
MYADLWRTIAEGKVWQGELRNRRKNGSYYWVETTIVPVADEAGRFSRYISIRTDITHLQAIQEQLVLAKEQAERASQAKSEFLSRMSHELRTPLNAILGFSQLLQSDPDEPLSEEQNESVQQVLKAGWHLLELINEVLDLSKIEAGKVDINPGAVALSDVLDDCRDLLAPLAEPRRITLHEDISGCAAAFIWADRMRLKQVLLNLLSNAVKYNREAGHVHVYCEPVGDDRVRISVADQGCGLSEEQLKRLYEPFNRFDAELGDVQGTGIGLVIARGLVTAMGGSIEVSSRPGEGSVFSVLLPRSVNQVAGGADESLFSDDAAAADAPAQACNVLYVEDNPANL